MNPGKYQADSVCSVEEDIASIFSDLYLCIYCLLSVCDFNGIKFSDGAERALECNGW